MADGKADKMLLGARNHGMLDRSSHLNRLSSCVSCILLVLAAPQVRMSKFILCWSWCQQQILKLSTGSWAFALFSR
jgi:hypothetical protein